MSQRTTDGALQLRNRIDDRIAPHRRADLHLVDPSAPPPLRLFDSGSRAFARVLQLVDRAERSIDVRAFLWRDDDAGVELGRALLRAAERGVAVHIRKDRIASNYEYLGPSGQSLFHKQMSPAQRVRTWFLATVYGGAPFTAQRSSETAQALQRHPNVTLTTGKFFDHSKLFIFDENRIVLGSMGIGDNHRHDWIDLMVEIVSPALVSRLRQRVSGAANFDPSRQMDFLIHSRTAAEPGACRMLGERLALIDGAKQRITVEMAYLGDRRFANALLRAVRRGVDVTLITSAYSDVLGDLNRATCDQLLRRSGAPKNLTIVLHPRVIHIKAVVIDGRLCDVGSANFTRISHGVYDEVNLYVDDPSFAAKLEALAQQHLSEGHIAGSRVPFRKHYWYLERAFIAFSARNLPR